MPDTVFRDHQQGGRGKMSRYSDWRTGTKYPGEGIRPVMRSQMEAALLSLTVPDRPWRVRAGLAGERADVVAECQMMEPARGKGKARRQLERTFKFRIHLDGEHHEVRVCADVREITRAGDPPRRIVERRTGSGPRTRVWSRLSHWEKDATGRRHRIDTVDFDSNHMRDPLQKIVLSSGWTWRGTHLA
ncbi:hypothetical protein ACIREE_27160 [Streptomyces sp. NPDC102467]|uniref:hypothetical protein n=1 Tax=Streptomyces sp. NPDC102467 TaxID=3366179 RepID=UPI0038207A48